MLKGSSGLKLECNLHSMQITKKTLKLMQLITYCNNENGISNASIVEGLKKNNLQYDCIFIFKLLLPKRNGSRHAKLENCNESTLKI